MRSAGLTASLFTLGLCFQQVVATGWTEYGSFNCPANTNNNCDQDQKDGLDWTGLKDGAFNSYKGFDFEGFECKNYNGKRDEVTKRTFNGKCASGVAKKDKDSSPKIKSPKDKTDKKFSIHEVDVSVDVDTDIEFHYTMEDGSECKHVSPCKKDGSTVKNTQCGGAKEVAVKLPEKHTGGDCGVNIHSVKFDCDHASSTKPVTKTKTKTYYSKATTTKQYTAAQSTTKVTQETTTQQAQTTPTAVYGSTTAPAETTPAGTTTAGTTTAETTPAGTTTAETTPAGTTTAATTTAGTTTAAETTPATSTTVIVYTSITTTPVTETVTYGASTYVQTIGSVTTVYVSSTSTISTTAGPESTQSPSTEVPTTIPYTATTPAAETTAVAVSTSTTTPVNCPNILPKCLNTWIFNTGCSDNSDTDCFCPQPDFTNNVVACVQAWGGDDAEVQSALSYLAGLCANHIAENPAIITACPSSITLGYAPTATVTGQAYPVTTVSIYQTVTVACVQSNGASAGYTIPGSSTVTVISTAVTVPQVALVTQAQQVVLAAGTTPAQVAAYPTTGYTMTTSYKPAGATNTTGASPFLGAASSSRMSAGGLVFAVAVGLMSLVL